MNASREAEEQRYEALTKAIEERAAADLAWDESDRRLVAIERLAFVAVMIFATLGAATLAFLGQERTAIYLASASGLAVSGATFGLRRLPFRRPRRRAPGADR